MNHSSDHRPAGDNDHRAVVIVAAAGEGLRMRGVDKVFAPLLGKPLIAYSLAVFDACPQVEEIVLVLSQDNVKKGFELMAQGTWKKLKKVCLGGPRRQDSVKAGLQHLSPRDWVVIHDGARPCVGQDLLLRGLRQASTTGAAIAGMPVKDTVKVVSPEGAVVQTPPRKTLWAVQTPQIFTHDLIHRAYQGDVGDITDDASLVERLGHRVTVFWGSYENIKVTTPEDLVTAEAILRARADP